MKFTAKKFVSLACAAVLAATALPALSASATPPQVVIQVNDNKYVIVKFSLEADVAAQLGGRGRIRIKVRRPCDNPNHVLTNENGQITLGLSGEVLEPYHESGRKVYEIDAQNTKDAGVVGTVTLMIDNEDGWYNTNVTADLSVKTSEGAMIKLGTAWYASPRRP